MSWVVLALAGAAVFGLAHIFDKTVIYRYATTPHTLPLLIGIAQTFAGVVFLVAVRVPAEATWEPVLWAFASGVVFGLSAQFLIRVLYWNEVSRTIPIFQSYPIFTAIYAFFFLGEELGAVEWLAVAVVVMGAVLISFRPGSASIRGILCDKAFVLLMIGSAIQGSAHVFGKVAVDDLPVLFTHALRTLGLGGVFLVFNLRSRPLDDVRTFVRTRSPALRFVAMNELVIAQVGFLLLWALALGPAALVTALSATRAFFLVVYTTVLALVWKGALGEVATPGVIALKLFSTALIVGGIAAIAMGSA